MRKSNLTYNELIELAPKDRPFQIEVEINPDDKSVYWSRFERSYQNPLVTFENNTHSADWWRNSYKGTFTLIDEYRNMYEKPKVLEVGTKVEILESIKDCGDYRQSYEMNIGRIGQICFIHDNDFGVNYDIDFGAEDKIVFTYPHYCIRPVENVEEKKEIITVNGKKYKLIEE